MAAKTARILGGSPAGTNRRREATGNCVPASQQVECLPSINVCLRGIAMTYDNRQFYIDGAWVDPAEPKEFKVINPATEAVAGVISMGSAKDVDRAVGAARRAFDSYSRTSPAERLALMERILAAYKAHYDEIAQAISTEMGAPITLAKGSQTRIGIGHISAMIEVLKTFKFEEMRGNVRLVQEPVGVCALITPWKLADESGRRESGARPRRRLHHGAQALRILALQRHSVGEGDARGGGSRGRVQSHQWRRRRRRRAADLAS